MPAQVLNNNFAICTCVGQREAERSVWQRCTDGFPPMKSFQDPTVEGVMFNSTRLIPDMKFTCSGTIVRVRVAGEQQGGNQKLMMTIQIWRKNITRPGWYYDKIGDIVLPLMCERTTLTLPNRCGMLQTCNNIRQCTLKMSENISVESGDILGIKLPPRDHTSFELYFKNSMVSNYIFQHNSPSTINLGDKINKIAVQPLIIIEVEPGIALILYFHRAICTIFSPNNYYVQ